MYRLSTRVKESGSKNYIEPSFSSVCVGILHVSLKRKFQEARSCQNIPWLNKIIFHSKTSSIMKTKLISSPVVCVLFMCTAVAFNCPGNPSVSGSTDNANYIHATALLKTYKDGYEWRVSNGAFIISGQGTNQISIGKDCPTGNVQACVRAYIYQSGGGICYSDEICTTITYSGPFLI